MYIYNVENKNIRIDKQYIISIYKFNNILYKITYYYTVYVAIEIKFYMYLVGKKFNYLWVCEYVGIYFAIG